MMITYLRRRNPKAKVVKWFWEVLSEATHEYRIQVFQWCVLYSSDESLITHEELNVYRSSGRTVFPIHVPEDLRYEIEIDSDAQKLPTTHTCFGLVRDNCCPHSLITTCIFETGIQHNFIDLSFAGPNHAAGCENKGIAEAKTRLVPASSASIRVCVAAEEQLFTEAFIMMLRSIIVSKLLFVAKCATQNANL